MKKFNDILAPDKTVFYALDKAIKTYRQFAQRSIADHYLDITIDQWLVLKLIKDHPNLNQKEIARRVFKDYASITRIIEILVKKGFLKRSFNEKDRRRYNLSLTLEGEKVIEELIPIVRRNRQTALEGFTDEDIETLTNALKRISENCSATHLESIKK